MNNKEKIVFKNKDDKTPIIFIYFYFFIFTTLLALKKGEKRTGLNEGRIVCFQSNSLIFINISSDQLITQSLTNLILVST